MQDRRYIAWCRACRRFGMNRRLLPGDPEEFICPSCDWQQPRSYKRLDEPTRIHTGKKQKEKSKRDDNLQVP